MYSHSKAAWPLVFCMLFLAFECPVFALTHDKPSPIGPIKRERIAPPQEQSKPKPQEQAQPQAQSQTKSRNNNAAQKTNRRRNGKSSRTERSERTRTRTGTGNHSISRFVFTDKSPYALLVKPDKSSVTIPLLIEGQNFVIEPSQRIIPSGTSFKVPEGYWAYCPEGDSELLNGRHFRAEYNGQTMVRYESGSEVRFTEDSGMILIPSAIPEKNKDTIRNAQAHENNIDYVAFSRREPEYENRSVKPEDVIATYEIPENQKSGLIRMHNEAMNMRSKQGRVERYTELLEHYGRDYLAAYGIALAEFEMDHGSASVDWCNRTLEINPKYLPAKQLKRKAEGIMRD